MQHVKHLIIQYADGELSTTQQERVRAHLMTCVECRAALAQHERVSSDLTLALRHLPAPQPASVETWWRAIRRGPAPRRRTAAFVPVLMSLALLLVTMMGPHQPAHARPTSTTVAAAPALNTTLYPPSPPESVPSQGSGPQDGTSMEGESDSPAEALTPAPARSAPAHPEPVVSPAPTAGSDG